MQRFKNILCVAASDSINGAALEHAAALAENNQARLTVVEVIDKVLPKAIPPNRALSPDDLQAKLVAEHQQRLEELVAPWSRNFEIQTRVLIGIPFLEIIREVLRNQRDLVIKIADNGGLLKQVFGSDDMHLLRKCPCPVWIVKSKSLKTYNRILASVDIEDYYPPEELKTRHQLNLQILEMASSLALSEFSELHTAYVWEDFGEGVLRGAYSSIQEDEVASYFEEVRQQCKQNLNALVEGVISKVGQDSLDYLQPQTHLLKGLPRKEIPRLAEDIKFDLVVMGTVARTGIPGFFMGNTAETILNRLDCSVLAVKPPGFASPVTLEGE